MFERGGSHHTFWQIPLDVCLNLGDSHRKPHIIAERQWSVNFHVDPYTTSRLNYVRHLLWSGMFGCMFPCSLMDWAMAEPEA